MINRLYIVTAINRSARCNSRRLTLFVVSLSWLALLAGSFTPAAAQKAIVHSGFSAFDDGDEERDADGVKNNIVVWSGGAVHVVSGTFTVDRGHELIIEPGAIVKFAAEFAYDQDDNVSKCTPTLNAGSVNPLGAAGTLRIDGAVLTDIRDDSAGGNTDEGLCGDALPTPGFATYSIYFSGSDQDVLTGSTIKYCNKIGHIGSMNITDNLFLDFGSFASTELGWNTQPVVVGAAPVFTGNTFEFVSRQTVGLDLRGMTAIVDDNVFRYSASNRPDDISGTAIRIGPALPYYFSTEPVGPQNGVTLITNNVIEMDNGIETVNGSSEQPMYHQVRFRSEIRNNTLRGVGRPGIGGVGNVAFNISLDAEALVTDNEASNFRRPVVFTTSAQTTESRATVQNNRFTLDGPMETSGAEIPESVWSKGIRANAENNYWGDPSGPLDNSNRDGLYNPRGRGYRLGNGIDYVPFIGGGEPDLTDEIRISVLASESDPLQRDATVSITVTVESLKLRSAPSGRIIAVVRDASGSTIEGRAEVSVTDADNSATLPAFDIKVPDDSPYITVEAELIPSGEISGTRSNAHRFTINTPVSRITSVDARELPDGGFPSPIPGKKLRVRARISYDLTTSSETQNGQLRFELEERVRGTKTVLMAFPPVVIDAPPGKGKSVETEVELDIPLRDVLREPRTNLSAKLLLFDDQGTQMDKARHELPIGDSGNKVRFVFGLVLPLKDNGDGTAGDPKRIHFLVGEQPVSKIGVDYTIKTPDVTGWQVCIDQSALDVDKRVLISFPSVNCPHASDLSTGVGEKILPAMRQVSGVVPSGARYIRTRMRMIAPEKGSITVAADSVLTDVREAALTASLDIPVGPSQVAFTPVSASLAFTSNQMAGSLTAEESDQPFASKAFPETEAAGKSSDYSAWRFIPLNRYWSIYGDLVEGQFAARATFSYDPANDFPADSGFDEDSLIVAGLNPLSGELEVLPSVLDEAAHTISTDYSPFFQTYIVASRSTVIVQTADEAETEVPDQYALDQNYPNPFNPSTIFAFRLPATGDVSLKVYNILGQELATLTEGPFAAGVHRIEWDGRDSAGSAVAGGVYLIRMQAGRFSQVRKAILLR